MRISGDTVTFKSDYPFFAVEMDGSKPNTVRVVPAPAVARLVHTKNICIKSPSGDKNFTRRITSAWNITEAMARCGVRVPSESSIVDISWEHEKEGVCDE